MTRHVVHKDAPESPLRRCAECRVQSADLFIDRRQRNGEETMATLTLYTALTPRYSLLSSQVATLRE